MMKINFSPSFTSIAWLLLLSHLATAQTGDSTALAFSGYVELYYAYDLGQPEDNARPPFIYSHNRHNEVNLNLGFVKAAYIAPMARANVALMAGTYANANLSAEPGVLKNIFEANAGLRLSRNSQTWLDAGIFPSHIGFESAIGKDCWTLTRSIMAENSPYFESGLKLSHTTASGKWLLAALVLNGWQRIQRVDGNKLPAFGSQISFYPNEKFTFNSSTFLGNDKPESERRMRFFHDLYGIFQMGRNWSAILGFDLGKEQARKGSANYNTWYALAIILRFQPTEKIALAARAEYFDDDNGVIIFTDASNSFRTSAVSLNFDYRIYSHVTWRIEGKGFASKDKVFLNGNSPSHFNLSIGTSMAMGF